MKKGQQDHRVITGKTEHDNAQVVGFLLKEKYSESGN